MAIPGHDAVALPATDDTIWRKIQETVATAVSASVRPLHEELAEVASRTGQTEDALARMDARFNEQLAERAERDSRINARMDLFKLKLLICRRGLHQWGALVDALMLLPLSALLLGIILRASTGKTGSVVHIWNPNSPDCGQLQG